MSRAVDVLAVLDAQIEGTQQSLPNVAKKWRAEVEESITEMRRAREAIAEVFAAARAYRASSDVVDVIVTGDRLDAALAACEPTDTDHNREAVDGLCVEENDDEQ